MFFILPVGVDYQARRYPVVTFSLIGLNTLVYLISLVAYFNGGAAAHELGNLSSLKKLSGSSPAKSIWYTYITTLFVHAGLFHLLGNMVYLFLFGSCVEDLIGRWGFAVFYLLGGVASDLAYIAFTPEHFASPIALGGASGAVSACMGGFILLFHRTRVEFKYVIFLLLRFWSGEFRLPAWLVLSFWFVKDLFFAVLGYVNESSHGGVAFGAHVGGFAAGLLMILAYKFWPKAHHDDTTEAETELAPLVPVVRIARPEDATPVYLCDGGVQAGPFPLRHVTEMIGLGSVGSDAVYWREGMEDWRSVEELR